MRGENIEALSKKAGVSRAQAEGLLANAIPLLVTGMAQNAGTQKGAKSLEKALDDHAADEADDLAAALERNDLTDGAKILQKIMGDESVQVQKSLARSSGLSSTQTILLLAALAPTLLSILGKKKQEDNVPASGLSGMLGSLLGTSSSSGSLGGALLGSLLGGNSNQSGGGSLGGALLGSLLGGGSSSSGSAGGSLLTSLAGSLLTGDEPEEEEQEDVFTTLLTGGASGSGGGTGGSLLGSLLGGGSSSGAGLGSLLSIFGDDTQKDEPETSAAKKKPAKKPAAKKTGAKKTAAKKTAGKKSAAKKKSGGKKK